MGSKTGPDAQGLIRENEALRAEIEDLRREHEELKEASALLNRTFESISEAVVVFDPATCIVLSCNPAATRVFGYGARELIGRPVLLLHESQQSFEAFSGALREALDAGQSVFNGGCRMKRKDGSVFLTEQTITEISGNGAGRTGFVAVIRDVTDQRLAEEAERESAEILKTVTDDLPAIVAYVDAEARYRFVNRVFENWRGRPRSEIVGRTVEEVVGEKGWEQIKPHLEAALSGETVSYEDVFTYPDGSKRVLLIQYLPRFSDEGGEALGVCALLTDITRQKRTEEEIIKYKDHLELLVELRTEELGKLNERLKEEIAGHEISQEKIKNLNTELSSHVKKLEEVNRELEAFSYSLAHDLSSPLRVIDGFSKLLEMHYLEKIEGEGRDFIKVIRGNAQKMGRFISDLLHLARLGKSEIRKAEVDMFELARLLSTEFRNLAGGRDVRFVLAEMPAAYGERTLLRQALFNLLSNAVKFTGTKERAVIEIGGGVEGDETVYFVKDNGVGFDMKHSGRLFGLFKRLHTESEFDGTGAGLAIVGRIVERHGGRVWAEGKVDEGAVFWFALPMR